MNKRDDDLMRGRNGAVSSAGHVDPTALIRKRQRDRARLMAVLLGVFVILIFAISIVKIQLGHGG
ncbi:hypothetical protein ACMGDH_03635 [Sphingomonas sp. DT-207]